MRAAVVIALCACSGPSKSPHPDAPSKPVPGLVWATEPQPFHLPHLPFALASDGTQLLLVGTFGWIAQLDPATGRIVRQVRSDRHLTLHDIKPLGKGTWIAVGLRTIEQPFSQASVAFVVDGATLAMTEIKLSPVTKNPGYAVPRVAVLADGGVAITGRGLPLAIYDPTTWAVRQVLDPAIGWNNTFVRGDILIASLSGATTRWDLSTNGQKKLPRGWTHVGIAPGLTALRLENNHVWNAILLFDDGTDKRLPDPIDALAVLGDRLLTTSGDQLRIHALPSGDIVKRITIKGTRRLGAIYPIGNKVALQHASVIRIVDLDTGLVSPPEQGIGSINEIAVGNDARVIVGSYDVTALAAGKVIGTESTGDYAIESFRRDDPLHYAVSRDEQVVLRTFGDPKATKTWTLPQAPRTTWIGRDGLLFDTFDGHEVLHTKGTEVTAVVVRNSESEVLDADADGDVLVARDGRVAVASQEGKAKVTITVPECQETIPEGTIEVGGSRAATFTSENLALWDRTTGKLLATAKYELEPDKILFVPRRSELLFVEEDRIVFWLPGKGTHVLAQAGAADAAVSSDGKKLALGYNDGHVTVWDVDALLAGPFGPDLPASTEVKPQCGEHDPLSPDAVEDENEVDESGELPD